MAVIMRTGVTSDKQLSESDMTRLGGWTGWWIIG
jgi:hypothetical protein